MTKKKSQEYAGQVADIARGDVRLSFNDLIRPVTDQTDVPYLSIFTPDSIYLAKLFRFENQHSLKANLPLRDLPLIKTRTQMAEMEVFKALNMKNTGKASTANNSDASDNEDTSKAYTVKFKFGSYAGKTPAEILTESPNDKTVADLNKQVGFLSEKADRFPQNKVLIEAINDALSLYSFGLLSVETAAPKDQETKPSDNTGFEVYSTPTKHFKHDVRGNKNLCYSLKITCYPYKTYPYKFEFMNCYAPLGNYKNGMRPVLMDQAEDIKRDEISLTESEWLYVLQILEENLNCVRQAWYPYCRKKDSSYKDSWKNNQPT